MCERKPGPRCNDKCKLRDTKLNALNTAAKSHAKNSFEYRKAASELVVAQEIYDTTPKGIEELSKTINIDSSNLAKYRYLKGRTQRQMQHDALKEIDNGRTSLVSAVVSSFESYFSPEEIESIIQSSRENREEFLLLENKEKDLALYDLNKLDTLSTEITASSGAEYYEYLDKMRENVNQSLNGDNKEKALEAIGKLEGLDAPSNVNLHVYRSMGHALNKSKSQLSNELSRIAAIQDSNAETIAEYFDAYKKLYNDKYFSEQSYKQPNPPKDWIEGELSNSGFVNAKSSNFIPRTPDTLFAIFKLRTDLEAIPDYLKLSTKITAIDYTDNGFTTTQVSRSGKTIRKTKHATEEELSQTIVKDLKDSVILMPTVPSEIYTKSKNKHRFISLQDMSKKHLDIFESSPEVVSHVLKVQNDTLSIYAGLRKKMLKTWATKNARSNSERLSFTPTGKTPSLQLVR